MLRVEIEKSLIVTSDDTENPTVSAFSEYFRRALECGVKPARIAGLVEEKPQTIEAWAKGEEIPGVYRRRYVLLWLKTYLTM
jgi:hypothetical protein